MCGSVSALEAGATDPLVCLELIPHCLGHCSLITSPGSVSPPTLFTFKIVLVILDPFHFHMNCRISLPISSISMLLHSPSFYWEHWTKKQIGKSELGLVPQLHKRTRRLNRIERMFSPFPKWNRGGFCASNKASQGQRWQTRVLSASLSPCSTQSALPLVPPLQHILFFSGLPWPLGVVPAPEELPGPGINL